MNKQMQMVKLPAQTSANPPARRHFPSSLKALFLAILAIAALSGSSIPASAELKLCNTTSSRVGVAIGYRDKERWATEGWWNVASNTCEVLLKGKLIARYYYIHAVDYDRGGEWSGKGHHVHHGTRLSPSSASRTV